MNKALIRLLIEEQHSIVVQNTEGHLHCFDGPGVSDLNHLLHSSPELLQGAAVADKVVGKAAAALLILSSVGEVYANVISQPALALLEVHNICTTYGILVPYIVNRTQTGMCPLETRCIPCHTPEECLAEIQAFIASMKH